MRTTFTSPDAPAPSGPYSQAVAGGAIVFLAGQGPGTLEGTNIDGPFEEQVRQVFRNLEAVARAAGGGLQDAIRVGVYLRDMDDFEAMNVVYREFFSEPYPARTTIQSNIPIPIEVDAVLWIATK